MLALGPGGSEAHTPVTTRILFNREVIRIFQRNCLGCHRPGGVAMSLATYDEARPWARAIAEEVLEKRMPPWPAVKGYGEFRNAPPLTPREVDMVVSWAEGGVPRGEEKDLPPPPLVSTDWPLGAPDLVLAPAAPVPLEGGAEERHEFLLPTGLRVDRWISAVDLQPGEPAVVHCATFWLDGAPGALVGTWLPGQGPVRLPSGVGRRLAPGSRLRVRLHHRGTDEAILDRSRVGIYLHPARPARALRQHVIDGGPEAPAAGGLRRRQGSLRLAEDVDAVALVPQADPQVTSLEVTAHRPDGSSHALLWARPSASDTSPTYVFKSPVRLPRGTRLVVTTYSRSTAADPLCTVLAVPAAQRTVTGRASMVKETVDGSPAPRANWLQIR